MPLFQDILKSCRTQIATSRVSCQVHCRRTFAGHSKWANIKHRKGAQDLKKAAKNAKFSKAITVAARIGNELQLEYLIERAKVASVPKEIITNAIKRASDKSGVIAEEVRYECAGPGGTMMLVFALTENRKRTAPIIRKYMSDVGGQMLPPGQASFSFNMRGQVRVDITGGKDEADDIDYACFDEDKLLEAVLDLADDISIENDIGTIYCSPDTIADARNALRAAGAKIIDSDVVWTPITTTAIDETQASLLEDLIQKLEDDEDVQVVVHNASY